MITSPDFTITNSILLYFELHDAIPGSSLVVCKVTSRLTVPYCNCEHF